MWQSTISLRYVSYKNADSNLHERICAMAMMAKNLLWSCAQIVAPRPPINPQRPNHATERKRAQKLVRQLEIKSATLFQARAREVVTVGAKQKPCLRIDGTSDTLVPHENFYPPRNRRPDPGRVTRRSGTTDCRRRPTG